jgi:hypothetical protein
MKAAESQHPYISFLQSLRMPCAADLAAHAAQLQRVLVGQLAAGCCHLQQPG